MRTVALLGLIGCTSGGGDGGSDTTATGGTGGDTATPSTPGTTDDTDTDLPGETGTTSPHTGTDTGASAVTVSCDPTDNALRFTCHVTVDPPGPVDVTFQKSDGSGTARVVHSAEAVADHDVGLWIMAPETDYDVVASAVDAPGETASTTFTTGSPPLAVSSRLTVTGTATTPYLGANIPCTQTAAQAGIWDTGTGELLWYEVMEQGGSFGGFNMVQFTEDHTVLGQTGHTIVEVDLSGADVLRKAYTDDFHHDLFRRHGKTWILFSETAGPNLTLDGFVVWDALGNELSRWHEKDALSIPGDASGDWSHTNTIWVDEQEDVLLSLHTQSTLVKVDTSGAVDWILAGTSSGAGLGQDYAVDWSAVGGADAFAGQHDTTFRADGKLQLLDNEDGRGLVMSLDETGLTATVDQAFSAGSSRCGPQGTTTEDAAGGMLVGCSGPSVEEYAPGSGSATWTASLVCDNGAGGGGPGQGVIRWYPLDGW